MKTIIITIALCILLLGQPAGASDQWTTDDTIMEGMFLGLLYLDKSQLNWTTEHRTPYMANPLLGMHNDKNQVDLLYLAVAIIHPVISYLLPRPWRERWQYGSCIYEGTFVSANASLGVGFAF